MMLIRMVRSFMGFDSSIERVDGDRRGSLPLVTSLDDSMESVSATSRFTSLFTKKSHKTNLKRTKSVTKLDRKRSSPNLSEHDASSLVGTLKRTMSLGRLSRKKGKGSKGMPDPLEQSNSNQLQQQQQLQQHRHQHRSLSSTASSTSHLVLPSPHASPALSLINARIRSARSHESLLASPPSMHSIDLSAPDVQVKPIHSSVLGEGQCFHVATEQGSKYISCTTAEERNEWLSSIRSTTHPGEENCRRLDSSLKLWVMEAKNLPTKKRYFCDILLDKNIYAQTSIKADMLFWGEHFDFEFKDLPAVETITINLFREADRKKKKDKNTLVGYINLNVADLANRQVLDKWITCSSGTVGKAGKETKSELPIIRIKVRKQTVDILPLEAYQPFTKYLTTDYKSLCEMLEPHLVVREKEEFATSLVHILQKQKKACDFLSDVVMQEIERLDDEHLTFRGNSIATKAMEAYMKLVGDKYLKDTLREFVRQLVVASDECEVDPSKVATQQLLACQQKNLNMYCDMAWVKIINSCCFFPNELREVFSNLRSRCEARGKADYCDNLISGCIFLRFLCPAILNPSLFNLTQEFPNEKVSRNLTLIAKTIQTLANFTQFGTKEEYMTFMNKFVDEQEKSMKIFLRKISSQEASNQFLVFGGPIDLGKELAVMHCLLTEYMEKRGEPSGQPFEELNKLLTTVSGAYDDPTIGQAKPKRVSQIYDNMTHIPIPRKGGPQAPLNFSQHQGSNNPETASSPTKVLLEMLHCGESTDDLPSLTDQSDTGLSPEVSGSSSTLTGRGNNQRSKSLSTEEEMMDRDTAIEKARSRVWNVSVVPGNRKKNNEHAINESWSQIVSAAENGDYVDLIPFMDDEAQNSSLEFEANATGSQVSIGPESTVASSGYQSFSHSQSQSNSPVDSASQQAESTREVTQSPVIQFQPSVQPLAFSNPLFRHQQQQQLNQLQSRSPDVSGTAGAAPASVPPSGLTHRGHPVSQAKTMRRMSTDSVSSEEDGQGDGNKSPGKEKTPLPRTTRSNSASVVPSDYQSSIAPLKLLCQLSSSSSEDSLNGQPSSSSTHQGRGVKSGSSASGGSRSNTHGSSTNSGGNNQSSHSSSNSKTKSGSSNVPPSSSLSNSAINGCSTFPRKHQRNFRQMEPGNDGNSNKVNNNKDAGPPLPPRDSYISSTVSQRTAMFQKQCAPLPYGYSTNPRPQSRSYPNRSGNKQKTPAGYPKPQPPSSSSSSSSSTHSLLKSSISVDSGALLISAGNPNLSQSSPSVNARIQQVNTANAKNLTGAKPGQAVATSNALAFKSNPPANLKPRPNTKTLGSSATAVSAANVYSPSQPKWQVARHVEQSSSSQETSSSSESSPQSLVRSTQQTVSSMHESSSAHSISSAPGYATTPSSSQPWGYTPSHSDSSSSLSSLSKQPRRPGRSDSSGSISTQAVSRISQTPSDSNSSVSSGNNNTSTTNSSNNNINNNNSTSSTQLDNSNSNVSRRSLQHISQRMTITNQPPPPSPNSFATRLSSRSDSHINTSSMLGQQQQQQLSPPNSNFSAVNTPLTLQSPESPAPTRSVSYHSPTDSPSSGTSSRSSYTASRSMDLAYLSKQPTDPIKRASTDSTLSQPGSMSPTGSGQSLADTANRRLSPQSAVHMGISSVQRKLQEQERTKQEYEQEVHVLRQQLLEAQERLQQAEMRLLDHEVDTHQLMDDWQSRLVESEEKMRRQQEEKDEQMKIIITRLQSIEEELKKEQEEMANAVEHKQQVIEVQEQRIRSLDQANQKLLQALAELKGRARAAQNNGDDTANFNGLPPGTTIEVAGFKTSSC